MESFGTRQKLSKLILEVLESHSVSLNNQTNVTNLVLYGFRTTAVCREDWLEKVSWGQRSPVKEEADYRGGHGEKQ